MARLVFRAAIAGCLLTALPAQAQYLVENLGRGVVAVRTSETDVYVGWRLLGTDPAGLGFNLYRSTGDDPPVRLNAAPLTATTDFVDATADLTRPNAYTVRPVLAGTELASSRPYVLKADAPMQQHLTIPLQRPDGGSVQVPPGNPTQNYTYSPNDASIADLDGDGEYEIVVKWDPSNSRDSASAGLRTTSRRIPASSLARAWRILRSPTSCIATRPLRRSRGSRPRRM